MTFHNLDGIEPKGVHVRRAPDRDVFRERPDSGLIRFYCEANGAFWRASKGTIDLAEFVDVAQSKAAKIGSDILTAGPSIPSAALQWERKWTWRRREVEQDDQQFCAIVCQERIGRREIGGCVSRGS